jgi:hypothetical protein
MQSVLCTLSIAVTRLPYALQLTNLRCIWQSRERSFMKVVADLSTVHRADATH